MPTVKIKIAVLTATVFFIIPLILGGFFIFAKTAQAQITPTVYSTADGGNWSDPNTWLGGQVPSTADSVQIDGLVSVNVDTSVAQVLVSQQGTLQNYANSSYAYFYALTVNGDVINNGAIRNNYYGFYINVSGNITNNGSWDNTQTRLTTSQPRQINTAKPIAGQIIFDQSFELTGSPSFYDLDFNNQTITLNSADQIITILEKVKLPGVIAGQGSLVFADNSSVQGSLTAPAVIFNPGSQLVGGVITADQLIFKGPGQKTFTDTTINGPLTIEQGAIVQNYRNPYGAYFYTLTVNGDIINNGAIGNNYYGFYINVSGNITNNGSWDNTQTNLIWDELPTATGYQLRLTQDRDNWPGPIELTQAKYDISALINQEYYWQARADLNSAYTNWSETKYINGTDEPIINPVIIVPRSEEHTSELQSH